MRTHRSSSLSSPLSYPPLPRPSCPACSCNDPHPCYICTRCAREILLKLLFGYILKSGMPRTTQPGQPNSRVSRVTGGAALCNAGLSAAICGGKMENLWRETAIKVCFLFEKKIRSLAKTLKKPIANPARVYTAQTLSCPAPAAMRRQHATINLRVARCLRLRLLLLLRRRRLPPPTHRPR